MRSLLDLLPDAREREFLADNGMFCDVDAFVAELAPPVSTELNELLGLRADARLVHIGQQVCTDYQPATLAKFEVVDLLAAHDGVDTAILWHDTDRADSEKLGMRIVLSIAGKVTGLSLAPRAEGHGEPRFIQVLPAAVDEAFEQIARWAGGRNQERAKPERTAAQERLTRLADAARLTEPCALGEFNARFAGFLLREGRGVDVPATQLSVMLDAGLLTASVDAYLNALDDVIAVFNAAVADLLARDIDPQVKPLPPDHLPLHYSCPRTGRRLRLGHVREGGMHLAASECPCGERHAFALGTGELSIAELAATGRWSPDVSLPLHHNTLASGWVVGRSTAIYGLVLNAVATDVFGQRPLPGLIPPSLLDGAAAIGTDSLLVEYLTR